MSQAVKRRLATLGDVLLAQIPANVPPGREQQGTRPVVVVATPAASGVQRFAVVVIVPLTTATGAWAEANQELYPQLEAGQGGLTVGSTAMIDHVQAVDARRVLKYYGSLDSDTYRPIRTGLERMFGFGGLR